jgi:PPOX class probable F420-dependent enzyme
MLSFIVPESHRDLLKRPINTVFITVTPQGKPHASIVWRLYDSPFIYINTVKGAKKHRNVIQNPNVLLVTTDPNETFRYLQIEGVVDEIIDDVEEFYINRVSQYYINKPYRGGFARDTEADEFEYVTFKIRPLRALLPVF